MVDNFDSGVTRSLVWGGTGTLVLLFMLTQDAEEVRVIFENLEIWEFRNSRVEVLRIWRAEDLGIWRFENFGIWGFGNWEIRGLKI